MPGGTTSTWAQANDVFNVFYGAKDSYSAHFADSGFMGATSGKDGMGGGKRSDTTFPNMEHARRTPRTPRPAYKDASDDGLVFQAFFGSGMGAIGRGGIGGFATMGSEASFRCGSPVFGRGFGEGFSTATCV
mmetsp:Transcript_33165/g.57899  ORF Transcript_33165/g.57899 Transcript_33165/m.57899 type:complete len:132 (+) Transcript_33165:3-398(+)